MKLDNQTKQLIDDYFNNKTPEELYEIAVKYELIETDEALNMRIVSGSANDENIPKPFDWLKHNKLKISEGETYKEASITIRQCASFISEYIKEHYR